jgi:hypothetical protein
MNIDLGSGKIITPDKDDDDDGFFDDDFNIENVPNINISSDDMGTFKTMGVSPPVSLVRDPRNQRDPRDSKDQRNIVSRASSNVSGSTIEYDTSPKKNSSDDRRRHDLNTGGPSVENFDFLLNPEKKIKEPIVEDEDFERPRDNYSSSGESVIMPSRADYSRDRQPDRQPERQPERQSDRQQDRQQYSQDRPSEYSRERQSDRQQEPFYQDSSYGNKDPSYGNKDSSYGNKDSSYGNKDSSYGNKDSSYGNKDSSYREPHPDQNDQNDPDYIPIFRSEAEEKMYYLIHLLNLEKQGSQLTKDYSPKSSLTELRMEYKVQKDLLEQKSSVKNMQKMLIFGANGLEFLNRRYDPVGAKLDGWSENIMENSADYDGIFERLYKKHKGGVLGDMAPELELLMALSFSGFTFHLTNTLFKTALPNLSSTIAQDPKLMSGLFNATVSAAKTTKMQEARGQETGFGGGPSIDIGSILNGMGLNLGAMSPMAASSFGQSQTQSQPQTLPRQGMNGNMFDSMRSEVMQNSGPGIINPIEPPEMANILKKDPPFGSVYRKQMEIERAKNINKALSSDLEDNVSLVSSASATSKNGRNVSIGKAKGKGKGYVINLST